MSPSEVSGDDEGVPGTVSDTAQADERVATGDAAVDEVLRQLDTVTDEPLDFQIEAGGQVHRVLQDRLADLGQE